MDWIAEQQERNVKTRMAWTLYAPHRQRVTDLLIAAKTPAQSSLCLLGAGNLNDVELSQLLQHFAEIVLVDVDRPAMEDGVARQGLASDARIRLASPTDVTGCLTQLRAIDRSAAGSGDDLDACLSRLRQVPDLGLGQPFDVVGSIGLMTQLIESVTNSLGESHPRCWEFIEALRLQHVKSLLSLARPGGAVVVVMEVVSSDTCPQLLTVSEPDLPNLIRASIEQGNFFTGTNPAAWQRLVQTNPELQAEISTCHFAPPWLWRFVARTYAVFGLVLRRCVHRERG